MSFALQYPVKTIWIVDGAYLFNYGRARPFDFLKLKHELERLNGRPFVDSYYLNASPNSPSDAQSGFHTWLKTAAPKGPKFRVQLYPLRESHHSCPSCGHNYTRMSPRGIDVGIVTLLLKLAEQDVYDRVVLATGDGEFEAALSHIKDEMGKQVWVLGAQNSLAPDLQSLADRVVWLDELGPAIQKDPQMA